MPLAGVTVPPRLILYKTAADIRVKRAVRLARPIERKSITMKSKAGFILLICESIEWLKHHKIRIIESYKNQHYCVVGKLTSSFWMYIADPRNKIIMRSGLSCIKLDPQQQKKFSKYIFENEKQPQHRKPRTIKRGEKRTCYCPKHQDNHPSAVYFTNTKRVYCSTCKKSFPIKKEEIKFVK